MMVTMLRGLRPRPRTAPAWLVLLPVLVLALVWLLPACSPRKVAPASASVARVDKPVDIDGVRNGYPGEPLQVAGAEVSLVHDGTMVYVYVRAPAAGWLAVGFNRQGGAMDGANFVLGSVDAAGEVSVQNHLGKGFSHGLAANPADEIVAYVGRQADQMILEFAYPLRFPSDNGFRLAGLTSGETISLLVAYHRTATSFLQHTSRGSLVVGVE